MDTIDYSPLTRQNGPDRTLTVEPMRHGDRRQRGDWNQALLDDRSLVFFAEEALAVSRHAYQVVHPALFTLLSVHYLS